MDAGGGIRARIVLVLHAHLPYVKIPGLRFPLQELWLYQNLAECYLPFLLFMRGLRSRGRSMRLCLSVSPTLLSMMNEEYYKERFAAYLDSMLRLLDLVCEKYARTDAGLAPPAGFLRNEILCVKRFFETIGGDVIGELRALSGDQGLSLITSCATHALLPAYRFEESLVRMQIETGLCWFEDLFGFRPRGFWLPEMGYFARLDEMLRGCGLRYTFLDARGVLHAAEMPRDAGFLPSMTGAGMLVFPRDLALSNAIWSRTGGYPGDVHYREFHFDYLYSISDEDLKTAGIERMPFGLKLYRITGGDAPKEYYDPERARGTARLHAADFLDKVRMRAGRLQGLIDGPPVFTLPFDMELFGHWWYEGIDFLAALAEGIAACEDLEWALPEQFLDTRNPAPVTPAESSWGKNGSFETWLNPECLYAYPQIGRLYRRLAAACSGDFRGRAAACALRELFLAQSSDWAFFVSWDNFRDYGKARLAEHLEAAERIIGGIESGAADEEYLAQRERLYPLFSASAPPSIP